MADDLVNSKKLVSLTRQQVEGLLGEPYKSGSFTEYESAYYLGADRGFRTDS